ncbi:MAG: hypothetical protein ACLFM7_06800 [Bacteroidales bacterium]
MKWMVNYELMDSREANEQAALVVNDILDKFEKLIPAGPPLGYKPLFLINDTDGGPTLYWPLGHDFYKIGLNIPDIFFNQVAFQFSQEFSRIYCDPRISNWFIDLIGHVAALYMLEYLSEKWENNPPRPELSDYYENFTSYRSNLLGTAFSKIDMVKYQISNEWVKNQIKKLMNEESYNRGKILLIAYEIMGLFKESEDYWGILPYVGKCSKPAPSSDINNMATLRKTEPDFRELLREVPKEVYPFVEKLVNKFGVFEEETS